MIFLSKLIASVNQFLAEKQAKRIHAKLLDKPKRSQLAFQKKYPRYKMGANCYGVPSIKFATRDNLLTIGSYCSIAKNVEIYLGGNHRIDWISSYPFPAFFAEANTIKNYEVSAGDVHIGSDVWLCQNSTILSGVSIGHGAVVANGAMVTKNVEPYAIVGGNPAKFIRWRFDEPTRLALLESAWWDWPESEILSVVHLICSDNITEFLAYAESRHTTLPAKIATT